MYLKNCYLLTLVLINIFGHVHTTDLSPDEAVKTASKFTKLLNSIATINEAKLKALKRFTELDKYNVANGILRIADDKQRDPMVAVMLLNKKNSDDNKLYEIFDADEVNTYGNTPIRNIMQRIKDHYNEVQDIGTDSTSSSESNSESEFDLEEILSNYKYNVERPYHENIERDGKESSDSSDTEEDNSKGKETATIKKRKQPSDGEEITPNTNKISPPNKRKEKTETSDSEEANTNKKDTSLIKKREEPSDGEEITPNSNKIAPVTKTPDDNGENIAKNKGPIIETLKAEINQVAKQYKVLGNQIRYPKGPLNKDRSDDEIVFHGNEKVKMSDIKNDKKHILRLFKKCNKEAVKRCKRACKRANKEVCKTYKCSKGMKRTAKKNCKIECKDYFTDH